MAINSRNSASQLAEYRLGDQLIRLDRAGTRQAYTRKSTTGAEECGCVFCRNFTAQKSTAFPASFLNLLEELGIDSKKEGEVYYLAPAEGGKRLYGGWFFFSGELAEAGQRQTTLDGVSYSVIGPGNMPSPYPRDSFGAHPLALEFSIQIPWVLSEHEDPDSDIVHKQELKRSKQ